MNKKVISLLLVFVLLASLLAAAVPTNAASPNEFIIVADKTEVTPGDTITYTVAIGPIANFQSANFTLVIPNGLTFVSGAAVEGLKELTGAMEAGFEESSLTFVLGGLGAYTADQDTTLMTFSCTADAVGTYEIQILDDYDFSDNAWTSYDMTINTSASKVTVANKPISATGIALNKKALTLKAGASETLVATLTPDNAADAVVWTSSNNAVATVNANGKVTAVAMGKATITAQAGAVSATCEVTVECAHSNTTAHPAVASTCSVQGNAAYTTCDTCHQVISGSDAKLPLDPANHVDVTNHPAEPGSCVANGHGAYTFCNDCQKVVSGSNAPVAGPHGVYVEKAEEKYLKSAADCNNAAVYYTSCQLCGEAHATQTFTYGTALGHSFTNYVSNNNATCTSDGTKTAQCDRCTAKDTVADTGSAKGHDFAPATCTVAKTCKVCGAVEGNALGHSYAATWSKGEDGHWHECTACGDKKDAAAHDYGNAGDACVDCGYEREHIHRLTLVPAAEASCTVAGNKAYYTCSGCENWFEDASGAVVIADKSSVVIAAPGHDFGNASCTEAKTCKVCGATEGAAIGHDYAPATCTVAKTCKVCGAVEGTALGHSFTSYVSNNDATCTADGTKTAQCDRCDVKDTVADAGSAKGHDYAPATCTAAKTCKVCGAVEGTALGHSFTSYVSNNDATCTADGTKTAQCDRCDVKDTVADAGSAKGHDYAPATCTAAKTCKVCGAVEGTALGHSFTSYVSNNDATCTADGTKTAQCDRCDVKDTVADAGSAKGHTYAESWSKGEEGHWHECSVCGDKKDIAAHAYDGDVCGACGYERAHVHSLTLVPAVEANCIENGSKAYYTCSGCEEWLADAAGSVVIADKSSVVIPELGHDMVAATCTEAAYCQREGCNYAEGESLGHNFQEKWSVDGENHWHDCSRCDAKADVAAHVPGAEATEETAQNCSVCGYELAPALGHSHKLTLVGATVSCTEAGNKAYYVCECGKWFEDAAASVEILDQNSVKVEALGHADENKDGKCDLCEEEVEKEEEPTTPEKPDEDNPQTGDSVNVVLMTALLVLSLTGIVICFTRKRTVA